MSSKGPFVTRVHVCVQWSVGGKIELDQCTAQGMHVACEEPRGPGVRVCVFIHVCSNVHTYVPAHNRSRDGQSGRELESGSTSAVERGHMSQRFAEIT